MNTWFDSMDLVRRLQGQVLDAIGLGADESAHRVIHARPGVRLRHYPAERPGHAGLLIVPAPIKRHYIWDLSPECSVVRRALERGLEVYLLEWTERDPQSAALGLDQCAGAVLDECLASIAAHGGPDTVFLAGHSLGGTLAALYSAYRPERVAGLILLEAPLHFAEATGAFRPLLESGISPRAAVAPSGRVPGSVLNWVSATAAPATFVLERHLDLMASLASPQHLRTHWRVERWTMDELSMPQPLFEDVVDKLYREDRFMRKGLTIAGVAVQPSNITAPLFAVYEPSSCIVAPQSVIAFYEAVGSRNKELRAYGGDVGVDLQHLGTLVGDNAHRHLWPQVFDWLERIGPTASR